jgi:predicted phage replisome organizer
MSDEKKYYYLKLKENFYNSEEMILLQNMPDGYLYSDILMKLYLRSLKSNGKLIFKDRIPYNANMLSQVVHHNVGIVEKALKIFKDLDMIEILDNGIIYMMDIQNFIGKSSSEADRKRNYRINIYKEKQNLLKDNGQMSLTCPDENPPEIEIEKEIDIEKEKEIKKDNNPSAATKIYTPEQAYQENIGLLTSHIAERIEKLITDGISEDLIIKYIQVATERNRRNWGYIEKMALGNLEDNIRTLEQYQAICLERNNNKKELNNSKFREAD